MSTQRFAQLAPSELDEIVKNTINANTSKSTKTWLNVYSSWATVRGHSQDIHALPPVELNKVLRQFFGEIRKKDGKEYEPDCLRVMLGALHRHLTSVNYPGDLITGRELTRCAREISDFVNFPGKLIPNFPRCHGITSTNFQDFQF